jgi:hypothetical protein
VFVNVILAKRALVRSYEICNARYYTDRIPYPHTHGEGSSDDPTNRDICPNGDNPFDVADCIVGITKYMDYETVITDHPGGTPAGLSAEYCGWELVQNAARGTDDDHKWKKYASA